MIYSTIFLHGFHGSSENKESACSMGDPGFDPWVGKSPAEGNGHPLQYFPTYGHLDCFHYFANMNNARIDTLVHMCFDIVGNIY